MRHLLLFGRRPRAGRVKTRLAPALGTARALTLYRAFLADQLRFARSFAGGARVEWWTDGALDPALDRGLSGDGLELRRQGRGDLGRRLARACRAAERAGSSATVVVGADSPTLPRGHVDEAFERLEEGAAAVLGPAQDGGYVLIGVRAYRPELFRDIPWDTPDVARVTRLRAAEAAIRIDEITPWYDVDDAPGLRRLLEDLRRPEIAARAPETARVALDWALQGVV
jgi:hypothetical protein